MLVAVLCGAFLTGCPPSTPGPCTTDSQCAPSRCCSGKCVDVQTSTSHCGACFAACSTQNGAAKCGAGVCSISCTTGFGDCNQQLKDGCETEVSSTARHCGTCGNACMSTNATSICERSQCLQSSCNPGFGDCNASGGDGCEVDLKSSLAHCGGCTKKCEILQGVGACMQSSCVVASCSAGFGNCDLSALTGCETDLTVSDAHCGSCGLTCGPGYKCKASKCVAPELLFYGGLLGIQSSLATDVVSAFNVDTHVWSAVDIAGAQTPGSRFAHVAFWDTAGKQMLVWGGFRSGNLPGDTDLWSLDYSDRPDAGVDAGAEPTWRKLVTTGGPTVNRGMMGWAWNKATRTLFLFGGTDANNNVVFDELWQLDVASLVWTLRTEPGAPPGGRFQAAMVWDSSSQRVLIGQGFDDNFIPTSNFYAFDPAADGGGWTALGAAAAPSPRSAAVFLGTAQPLHLWGGFDDMGDPTSELHRLDELDGGAQWTRLMPANAPTPRGYVTGTGTTDRRFAFGGFSVVGFNVVPHSEVLELSEDAGWTVIADGGVNFVHPGTLFSSSAARE